MSLLKAFTWNMQRGRTLTPKGNSVEHQIAEARFKLLSELMSDAHIGFITEPGMDLRSAVAEDDVSGLKRLPDGDLHRDTRADNQAETSACRPLLFTSLDSDLGLETRVTSGKDSSARYPCAQVVNHSGAELLLVSLHATSGRSGKWNTEAVIGDFRNYVEKNNLGGMIVGGDFNMHLSKTGKGFSYAMPTTPTNQGSRGGKGIDGFYFFSNLKLKSEGKKTRYIIRFDSGTPTPYHLEEGKRVSKLNVANNKAKATLGFFIQEKYGPGTTDYRLSDHAPVLIEISTNLQKAPKT